MKYQVVILAAGKGTRMKNDSIPKVLSKFNGSTMIQYLLNNLNLTSKPVVVVGYEQEQVRKALGDKVIYAEQTEQLGTGHAVLQAKTTIDLDTDMVIVLNGDQPLADQVMIDKLVKTHHNNPSSPITMGTLIVDDFNDWRLAYKYYGRIVRGEDGEIQKIVEYKDATDEEKLITEVNPSCFAFDTEWLWNQLDNLDNNNSQSEFYLTDVVEAGFRQNQDISTVVIDTYKGLGANTPEQLANVEYIFNNEIKPSC